MDSLYALLLPTTFRPSCPSLRPVFGHSPGVPIFARRCSGLLVTARFPLSATLPSPMRFPIVCLFRHLYFLSIIPLHPIFVQFPADVCPLCLAVPTRVPRGVGSPRRSWRRLSPIRPYPRVLQCMLRCRRSTCGQSYQRRFWRPTLVNT